MKTRDITVSVTLDWAPMLAQLDALAEHVRALSAACGEDIGDEKPCPCVLRSGHDGEHACLCENTPALPATAPEDENTPPASQNGPQEARSADSGTGGPPEPENAAQGRIGWLRLRPTSVVRYLTREVPGGWTDTDLGDHDLVWAAENWPNAEFTPIRTLADDEVAVKRDVVDMVTARLEYARRDAMEDGRSATETALANTIAAFTDSLEAGEDRG